MRGSFLRDALRTWLAVIRRPGAFFAGPPAYAVPPWPFAVAVYTLSMASCVSMQLWALGNAPVIVALGAAAGLLAGLLVLVLWLLGGGLLLHAGLRVAGVRTRPLGETYRCLCYASAPLSLCHIPFIGLPLGLAWTFFVGLIGMRHLHRDAAPGRHAPCSGLPAGGHP